MTIKYYTNLFWLQIAAYVVNSPTIEYVNNPDFEQNNLEEANCNDSLEINSTETNMQKRDINNIDIQEINIEEANSFSVSKKNIYEVVSLCDA